MIQIFEYKRQLLTRTKWVKPNEVDLWIRDRFDKLEIEARIVTYWLVEGGHGRILGIYHGKDVLKEIK